MSDTNIIVTTLGFQNNQDSDVFKKTEGGNGEFQQRDRIYEEE